jgi:tetratricopeptide (TPR) repeat protein
MVYADKLIAQGQYKKALDQLLPFRHSDNGRFDAGFAYTIAEAYSHMGDREKAKHYYILSAIEDLKEEYIARYMDQCSVYLEKMRQVRTHLNKLLSTGQMKEHRTTDIRADQARHHRQCEDCTIPEIFHRHNLQLPHTGQEQGTWRPGRTGKAGDEHRKKR